ncbi:hypothetical protein [Pelomonas sp. Root1237]|uniref:hypothetical protein n=1 Tax=Pelomonas sp. Root1237 TaxID=1736434 RepID=UPI0006FDFB24|nr:hypothetical protein [Pelomonas sp. Root1237]KQV95662.1 hypothetical protein ASC91_25525 [Pelomonas sp. Root1237]
MKKQAPFLISIALLVAPLCHAASKLDLGIWMRSIDHKSVSVQKALGAGRHDEAAVDAQALQKLYADMTAFFEKDYPAADAVGFSREGERQAAAITTALAAGDVASAKGAARAIALACNDCHDPYKPLP